MRINVFPRPGRLKGIPGVLGLHLRSSGTSIGINFLPGILKRQFENLSNEKKTQDFLIQGSVNPINLGGLDLLAEKIKETSTIPPLKFMAPSPLNNWLTALMQEHDYSSQDLESFKINPYSSETSNTIIKTDEINIEYIRDEEAFCEYIFKIYIKGLNLKFYFCELSNPQAPFPEELQNSDILIINLSNFSKADVSTIPSLQEKLVEKLAEFKVKKVFFPDSDGILCYDISEEFAEREFFTVETHTMDLSGVEAAIIHEKEFRNYCDSVFPVVVSDEENDTGILLGLGLGTALHQRLDTRQRLKFSSAIIPVNSYNKVFSCWDILKQSKSFSPPRIICGTYMGKAISHFLQLADKLHSSREKTEVLLAPSEEKKTTEHLLLNSLQVLMVPYPGKSDCSLARIKDTSTEEFLIYTETVANPEFLEYNLSGVDTLVVALEGISDTSKDEKVDFLKKLQKKSSIQRLIILLPGESIMSDLDI